MINVLLFPALTTLTLTATEQFNRGAEYYGAGKTLRAAVCLRKSLQLDSSDQIVLDAFHETAETLLHENNLAAAEANHARLLSEGGLALCMDLVVSNSAEVQQQATRAIGNLALAPDESAPHRPDNVNVTPSHAPTARGTAGSQPQAFVDQ